MVFGDARMQNAASNSGRAVHANNCNTASSVAKDDGADQVSDWVNKKETPPACAVTEPSLSNQSNKWGQPWQQQAFRKSGLAQMLPTVHDPEVNI